MTLIRRRLPARSWRWAPLAAGSALTAAALAAAGTERNWSPGVSPAVLAAWSAAAVLAVALAVAVSRRRAHAGWFHPLSLPLAAVAVMLLAAPLWVTFTHQPAGLLYDPGHEPAGALPLAAAVSPRAFTALTLTVAGYLAGAVAALALACRPAPARVQFRCAAVRRAGFTLMSGAACAQVLAAALAAGTRYGAGQTRYGLAPALAAAASSALLAGLVLVTLAASHAAEPRRRLRDLLRGREWAALSAFVLAVALPGDRGGLIAPGVYLAWAYSTQVRPVRARWVAAGALAVLAGAAVIAGWRAGDGLDPGSPAAITQSAAGDVSSPAWLTQQTAARLPSEAGYLHGSTYLAAAAAQLPGPLARASGATSRTGSAAFRDLIGFTSPDQGFAEAYPAEAYLNFGLPGCLAAGLLLGALTGRAWRRCRIPAARPGDLLYPLLLAGLVYGLRSDAVTQVKDVLYPLLAAGAVMARCRVRAAPPDGGQATR